MGQANEPPNAESSGKARLREREEQQHPENQKASDPPPGDASSAGLPAREEGTLPPPAPLDVPQVLDQASEVYGEVQKSLRPITAMQAKIHAEVTRTRAA